MKRDLEIPSEPIKCKLNGVGGGGWQEKRGVNIHCFNRNVTFTIDRRHSPPSLRNPAIHLTHALPQSTVVYRGMRVRILKL